MGPKVSVSSQQTLGRGVLGRFGFGPALTSANACRRAGEGCSWSTGRAPTSSAGSPTTASRSAGEAASHFL